MAQQVERVLGKDEVTGPNPVSSSTNQKSPNLYFFGLAIFFVFALFKVLAFVFWFIY